MLETKRSSASNLMANAGLSGPRLAIFVIVGLTLCWLVVSHSLVAYLSATAPQTTLFLRRNEPKALVALVNAELNNNEDQKDNVPARKQLAPKRLRLLRERVETALMADPLSSRAYRLLGQIAERQGFADEAEKFMRAATRHSLNESFAVYWMMRKNFERKNYAAAAIYADALLRSTNRHDVALPFLAQMAEDKNGKVEVEKLLLANPSWRSSFFSALGGYVTDARTPLKLFFSLKDTQASPTPQELNAYQSWLIQHDLYDLAYYVWLQFMPSEKLEGVGFLCNGDFEAQPSGSPFDWQWAEGKNVTVDFVSRPENSLDHALVIEFGPGRVEFPTITQAMMLPPGEYIFKGSLMGDVVGPRGLQWSLSCIRGGAIGQSEMILGSFVEWRSFEFPIAVPDSGCSAQSLQLTLAARSASEQLISGEIWFDELSISRNQEQMEK